MNTNGGEVVNSESDVVIAFFAVFEDEYLEGFL